MPSTKSKLINFTLRNRHLLKLQLKRETWDMNTSVALFREACEKGASKTGKLPAGIQIEPTFIPELPEGLKAEWIYPGPQPQAGVDSQPVIFYVHGGGYISGSCADHRGFVAKITAGSGIATLLYEYRLAPEHPFPAALDDSLAAYRWLLSEGCSPSKVVFVGESAGGGLLLALLLALRDRGIPLPAGGVAISPWTDLALTGESYRTKVDVCISPLGMNAVCCRHYTGEHDPTKPLISPLYGDLHGLPPLLINVGMDDTLCDDSIRFAAKAREAGVSVRLREGEGMVHCYPLLAPLFPEATEAMEEICGFIRKILDESEKAAA